MSCPANPQPPGFFDLTAPHSTNTLVFGVGCIAVAYIWLAVYLVFSFHPRARRLSLAPHPRLLRWLSSGYTISGVMAMILLGLSVLWVDALDLWSFQSFQTSGSCPAATNAVSHALQGAALVMGAGILLTGISVLFLKFWLALVRRVGTRQTTR